VPGELALVTPADWAEAIAPVAADLGLDLSSFDSVQALLDGAEPAATALVVLYKHGLDESLPTLIESLMRRFPHAPVVVACVSITRRAARALLAAGVAGVVLHEEIGRALGPCLRAAQAGQVCLPRRYWRQIEPPILSVREKQVLGLVVMGFTNGQIAEKLFLAESTVKSHLSSAFGKLGVGSRHEAVARILDPQTGLGIGILTLAERPLEVIGEAKR
jgi:DNA-binding NarL/FixJ family response regulator